MFNLNRNSRPKTIILDIAINNTVSEDGMFIYPCEIDSRRELSASRRELSVLHQERIKLRGEKQKKYKLF